MRLHRDKLLLAISLSLLVFLLARSVWTALDAHDKASPYSAGAVVFHEPPSLPPAAFLSGSEVWVVDPAEGWLDGRVGDPCEVVMAVRARYPRWAPASDPGLRCMGRGLEGLEGEGALTPLVDEGVQFSYDEGTEGVVVERRGELELVVDPALGLVVRRRSR